MSDLDLLPLQKEEYNAWLDVIREWNHLHPQPSGFAFDSTIATPFVNAIKAWGEYLVSLRVWQDKETRERAMKEMIAQYERTRT